MAALQVSAQGCDLAQRAGVKEHRQVKGDVRSCAEIDFRQTCGDCIEVGQIEPRARQDRAQRIDVVGDHAPAKQRSFDCGRAAPAKRIVNDVAGRGQA